MRKKKYEVTLKEDEREELKRIIRNPREQIKRVIKAKVLLKMDEGRKNGDWNDKQIWQAFDLSPASVVRLRRQFGKEGYEAAISRRPYPKGVRRKFDGDGEAKLIALCCSAPVDDDYKDAEKIILVMDNLNTHAGVSLYKTFPQNLLSLTKTGKHAASKILHARILLASD